MSNPKLDAALDQLIEQAVREGRSVIEMIDGSTLEFYWPEAIKLPWPWSAFSELVDKYLGVRGYVEDIYVKGLKLERGE